MPNPVQITAALSLFAPGVNASLGLGTLAVAMTGTKYAAGIMAVPTLAGGTAIPVANLANLGLALFLNMDTTNYAEIMTAVAGTAFAKLMPGEVALFRFDGETAPAMIAHTGAVNVQYLILEN